MIHRFWNNAPVNVGHWFLFPVTDANGVLKTQDIQWYIHDTGNLIAASLILGSFLLLKTKTKSYNTVLKGMFVISLIDIAHYWLWYRQQEEVVLVEGLIMIATTLKILLRSWRKH